MNPALLNFFSQATHNQSNFQPSNYNYEMDCTIAVIWTNFQFYSTS